MGALTEKEILIPPPSLVKTKEQAIVEGLRFFRLSTPCRQGHFSERYVSDSACRECKRGRARAFAHNNPGYKAGWYAQNEGYSRDWYAQNRDREREKMRVRRAAKPEVFAKSAHARRARAMLAEGSFTSDDVKSIRVTQCDKCVYCRTNLGGKGHVDHIHPLSRGGSNWASNIQILCVTCNTSKGSRDPYEFECAIGGGA